MLAAQALNVHTRIWQTGFISEMREWSYEGSTHDDALDAVAGCLRSEPIRLPTINLSQQDIKFNQWQGTGTQFQANMGFEVY